MNFRKTEIDRQRSSGMMGAFRRYELIAACLVITLCFFIANDAYGARQTVNASRQLFTGEKKVIDYQAVRRAQMAKKFAHSDLKRRYLVDGRRKQPRSLLRAFAGGDACNTPTETVISTLPYNDPSGTLLGKTDNYWLDSDVTDPTATGCPTCTATGGVYIDPNTGVSSGPRGAVFAGTGLGPDAAYSIKFNQNNANITATMDPTSANDDLALIVYTGTCSDSLSDAIVIDDSNGGGAAESVTITNMPAGTYHIVADVYSSYYYYYYYGTIDPGGPYTLNVTCVAGQTCIQPAATTAAGVQVSGRVLAPDGRGLRNAVINLAGQNGQTRTAVTGPNGAYIFSDVESGQTYVASVVSRRFAFTPRAVQINDNLTDLDFTPEQ